MNELKEKLETLAARIEAKRKPTASTENLGDIGFAAVDSYNKALTEAAEIIRSFENGENVAKGVREGRGEGRR